MASYDMGNLTFGPEKSLLFHKELGSIYSSMADPLEEHISKSGVLKEYHILI